MATNENYIGVAMGLDVTDLKAGIAEANKQIQLANSEFKAASSGMEDWTKSTEGLTAKVKQLESVLTAQKSKLSGLQAEYEKVAKEQGENSEAARKLQVQINNQQSVVNSTQREFDNYTQTLKEAADGTINLEEVSLRGGKAVQKMGDSANEAGGKLDGLKTVGKAVGVGLAAVGTAAIGAIGSFLSLAESTRETRENFAKLETAFESAGHTTEAAQQTYADFYSILGDEGQATEAISHLAKLAKTEEELSNWTEIATGVYATFGDSLPIESLTEAANETAKTGQLTGSLADALNWAGVSEEEFQARLDGANSEAERAYIINEQLTDLYYDQAMAYRENNSAVMDANKAQAELNAVLAELGAIAEPIMTTLKLLAVDLLGAITPFVEMIGTGLQDALNGTAGASQTLADGLGGILNILVEKAMEVIPTVLDLILQLVPSIANTLLNALPQLLSTVTQLVIQVINMLSTLLPQILAKIVEILPMLINSLIAAIPSLLQAATTLLLAIVQAIPTLISSLVQSLPSVITTIIDAVVQSIPILLDAAIQLLNAIVDAIPVIIQTLVQTMPDIIDCIINGVLDALPLLLDAAIELFFAIIDAIPVIVKELYGALPDIIETILRAISDAIPKLFSTAKTLFDKIIDAVGELIKKLPGKMGEIITAIVSGLTKGISKIKEVGSDIIKGLWNGINDMADWIGKKIKGFGESVLGGIKDFFGIKSPSRLMEEEVGKYIGQGVGVGILDSMPFVKKQIGKFSDYVAANMGGIKTGLSLGGGGTGISGGAARGARSTVINAGMTVNYNGKLSRKELKRLENDNYTAIHMKLKAEGAI